MTRDPPVCRPRLRGLQKGSIFLSQRISDGRPEHRNQPGQRSCSGLFERLQVHCDPWKSLDEAERNYHGAGDAFSLKNSMGHLRSSLEGLNTEAFPILIARFGGSIPATWGKGLAFLRIQAVLSPPEERFVADLYTIISDEAVHSLATERGYARLCRNVVIEYALLFLWKLEKLGVKPSDEQSVKNT